MAAVIICSDFGASKDNVCHCFHCLLIYLPWSDGTGCHDLTFMNIDGVITHLEPDILECEVKWALGSITMNKASGGDGITVELFQILEDDAVKVLHTICQQMWKTQQWPQNWKRSVFIPIPKKGNAKECSNFCTIALISHASEVMLKIFQASLQQYVNHELPDIQAGFRKGSGTRDQVANICCIIEKAREFQKNIYFCCIYYQKPFNCVDHNKLENSSRDGNIWKLLLMSTLRTVCFKFFSLFFFLKHWHTSFTFAFN